MIRPMDAFNIVVRYGFCTDCRWEFESNNCVKCDCFQYVEFIKNTMEKQIPKQPHYYKENPHCKCGYVITAGDDFCRKCGQMIDWSE